MSVYVDDMRAPYGRMIMCHMIADSSSELHSMADAIGVPRKWCQYPGTNREHYDISLVKRALAVAKGATEIRWRETAARVANRKVIGYPSASTDDRSRFLNGEWI